MKKNYFLHGRKLLALWLIIFLIPFSLKATKVPFASTDVFATVYATMADGDTLLLTTPGSIAYYTNFSAAALTKSITIMGDPSLTSRPVLSTLAAGSVFVPNATATFSKIEFLGIEAFAHSYTDTVVDSRYFLDARLTTGLITTLKFKKCYIHGYSRNVIRADGSAPVFTNLIVDSCLFNDNSIGAASYPIFGVKSATISNISITNSTFYNSPGNIITYSKNNVLTFLMQNCNIIDCGSFKTRVISGSTYADSNPGRLIDFTVAANAASTFTISNTIISGKYTNKDNRPLANKVNTGPYTGANIIRFNTATATNVNFINSVLLDNVFNTPAAPGGTNTPISCTSLTYNYPSLSIITVPNTISGIGDPIWKLNITDASLSDLKIDGTTVSDFAAGTLIYNVVLPYGTTIVPTISASTADAGATTVITQAPSVTGSATAEVTAEDGTTKKTYTINFSVAAPSTDATLTTLSVAGCTLMPSFNRDSMTYSVLLPVGTTIGTLPAITYTTAANATAIKTDAVVLPGSTTIEVTAQDGTTKLTYIVNFTLPSSDANLTALSVAGNTLIPVFDAATLTYNVFLPVGSTIGSLPSVSYATTAYATSIKTDATALPGATYIEVTAQDGITKKTYSINFAVTSTNATLTSLSVDNCTLSPAFDTAVTNYNVVLPIYSSISRLPSINYTAASFATAIKTDALSLPGVTTIFVTAQDGVTTKTYNVNFSVAAPSDGDFRSLKTGGGWGSAGTFEVYSAATDSWASSATAPAATNNVTIMDGVFQTSNVSNWNANTLMVGQGNAFEGTAVLTGTAVSRILINNSGALMANPGVTFIGAGTTAASATPTYKMVGAYYRNKGTGYTNATVTIGGTTAWAASTAYTVGQQRMLRDTLYTVVVAGTSGTMGPIGNSSSIIDGTVTWRFAGKVAKAHALIGGGQITGIVVDDPGAGYVFTGASLAPITITGDGTGASYAIQMGIDSVIITNGGNYTVAPQVLVGSVMQVGNATTVRTGNVNGDLYFRKGANIVSGAGSASITQTLNVGGNLKAESPVSFNTVVPTSTSSTTVVFNKASSTSTISGTGSIVFKNVNSSTTATVINNGNISITGTSNIADFITFDFTSPSVTGVINATTKTVALTVPYGTNITALSPVITVRGAVNVSPASGLVQNFSSPVTYNVKALNNVLSQNWTASVTVTPASSDASLTALSVAGNTLLPSFNKDTLTYSVTLPYGTTVGTMPAVNYTTATFATAIKTDAAVLPGATTIEVTAQDGITKRIYTINFTVAAPSTNDNLIALAVTGYSLSPVFDAATLSYSVELPYGTLIGSLPTVTYTTAASAVAVKTDATALPGATTIEVTAQDGTTKKTYTINFTIATPSSDATLTALAVAGYSLNPAFDAATLSYSIELPYGTLIGSLPTVTYNAAANATVVKTDAIVLPGATTIEVTAQDGVSKKIYTINFTVTAPSTDATLTALAVAGNTLTPAFDAATLTYDVLLPAGTTIGTLPSVTYTAAINATAVKTDAIALPGSTTIEVTAQDGVTKKTYTINFTVTSTDATLTSLSVVGYSLSPSFDAATINYSIELPYGTLIGSLPTITYTTATTATAVKTDATALPGATTIEVTAQDGSTKKTYTINFTVAAPSTDATLTALSVAGNTLTPSFDASTLTYSVLLPAGTTIGTLPAVTYTTAANATAVKTDAIALPGSTTIEVTAQDGTTKKTYTINFSVTSTDATLTALSVDGYTLSPSFNAATLTYNVSLAVGTTIGSLPAVNYTTAANATAVKTDATALPGATTIEVTAQDGVTKKTYTINFSIVTLNKQVSSGSVKLITNGNTVTIESSEIIRSVKVITVKGSFTSMKNVSSNTVTLRNLKSGAYILIIKTDNNEFTRKVGVVE